MGIRGVDRIEKRICLTKTPPQTMTANPAIFQDDRCLQSLPIATIHDPLWGTYTAYYIDMPYLVVQVKNKDRVREKLMEALAITLKYYKR